MGAGGGAVEDESIAVLRSIRKRLDEQKRRGTVRLGVAVNDITDTLRALRVSVARHEDRVAILAAQSQRQGLFFVTCVTVVAIAIGYVEGSLVAPAAALAIVGWALWTKRLRAEEAERAATRAAERSRKDHTDAARSMSNAAERHRATVARRNREASVQKSRRSSDLAGGELKSSAVEAKPAGDAVVPRAEPGVFSALQIVDLLSNDQKEYAINSLEGLPFETPLVSGRIVFKLRPDSDSDLSPEYQGYFGGRKRRFSLQVQCTFKKTTRGIVFIGAEVGHAKKESPDYMKLTWLKRIGCKLILKMINMIQGSIVHFSFGAKPKASGAAESSKDSKGGVGTCDASDNLEMPHITLPLVAAVDTYVESGPGTARDAAPPTGVEMFPETAEERRRRKKTYDKRQVYHKGRTYSFSMHNSNLDLVNWMVVGIPGVSRMDLTELWRDMPLRVCAYVVDGPFNTRHTEAAKEYLYCFRVTNSKAQARLQAQLKKQAQKKRGSSTLS